MSPREEIERIAVICDRIILALAIGTLFGLPLLLHYIDGA